jgi:hypothetical protein
MGSTALSAVYQMKLMTSLVEKAGADLSLNQCRDIEMDIKRNLIFGCNFEAHDCDGVEEDHLSSALGSWGSLLQRLISVPKVLTTGKFEQYRAPS